MNRKLMCRINVPVDITPRKMEESKQDLIKLLAREVYNYILNNPNIVRVMQSQNFDFEGKKSLPYIELRAIIELSNYDIFCKYYLERRYNMTNRDKINNMSNEEFADFIYNIYTVCEYCIGCNSDCKSGIVKWLESEVEE